MQRLQAIEQDWSTINGMRQDFESTKAKLKTLMHRELTPQTHSLPPAPRAPRATPGDHASHTYSPRCDPMDNAAQYAQQQKAQMHGANTELDMAADMAQSCRGMDGVSQTAGTVAVECSKPYSQWHRYEQRLQAREAEAEAAELRSEVCTDSSHPLVHVAPRCHVACCTGNGRIFQLRLVSLLQACIQALLGMCIDVITTFAMFGAGVCFEELSNPVIWFQWLCLCD